MLTLSDSARAELDAYFDGKERSAIRVYLAPGTCGGPRLALALDDPRDHDSVFDSNGYSFCVNSELAGETGAIRVDYADNGFSVDSERSLGGGCGGCTGCQ
jgi:Fe-S cluster assembly iron-binding protein IscA